MLCFLAAVTALVAVLRCYSKLTFMTLALAHKNVLEYKNMIVKIAPVSAIHIQSECLLVSAMVHLNINTFTNKLLIYVTSCVPYASYYSSEVNILICIIFACK